MLNYVKLANLPGIAVDLSLINYPVSYRMGGVTEPEKGVYVFDDNLRGEWAYIDCAENVFAGDPSAFPEDLRKYVNDGSILLTCTDDTRQLRIWDLTKDKDVPYGNCLNP